jgi:uncharacterized protein
MIIIADTTPLSELAKIDGLWLLAELFGEIIIPAEVFEELSQGSHPAAKMIQSLNWIAVCNVENPEKIAVLQQSTGLHLGECSAIILAQQLSADRLLLDEQDARKVAISYGLPVVGTVGVLILRYRLRWRFCLFASVAC